MDLSWVKKIDNAEAHVKKVFAKNFEMSLLFEITMSNQGLDSFLKIYENWNKSYLRFVHRYLVELMKIYIEQNPKTSSIALARMFQVDHVTVCSWKREAIGIIKKVKSKKQLLDDILD